MYSKDEVAKTVEELGHLKIDPPVELGTPDCFGLGLDLFDPVSRQIITIFRPSRSDIGQSEIRLTAAQVVTAVAGARTARLHEVRAAGFASLQDADEAEKRAAAARDLAAKHAAEQAKLNEEQAAAANKLAEEQSAAAKAEAAKKAPAPEKTEAKKPAPVA